MLDILFFAFGLGCDPEVRTSAIPSHSTALTLNSSNSSMSEGESAAITGVVSKDVTSCNSQSPKNTSRSPNMVPGGKAGGSAPSSPSLQRKNSLGSCVESKIPRPSSLLASPTPLRRSGSLRLRGEKLGFAHNRNGRGGSISSPVTQRTPTSGNHHFPSITEADEVWRNPRRGAGDSSAINNLGQRQHHRSLQSLSCSVGRTTSVDSYPHTPTPSPEDRDHLRNHNLNRFLLDHAKDLGSEQDDLDSLRSFGSNYSTQSACDHAHFARNGTTFSGRRMKYVVHCSSHTESEEYLTPTQRANRQIRRLKALLDQSKKDLEGKDENIFRLTKEVVELRLLRDEADGVGAVNGNETSTVSFSSPLRSVCNGEISSTEKVVIHTDNEMGTPASLSDSGHFDDLLSTTSAQSSNSPGRQNIAVGESERVAENYQRRIDDMVRKQSEKSQEDRKSLIDMYERKMEDMAKRHSEKAQDERKSLTETYERKMEEIAQMHHDKNQEDRKLLIDMYEKKIMDSNHMHNEEEATIVSKYDQIIREMEKKHGQTLQDLKEEQTIKMTEISNELHEVNQKYSDLQQELFQARERCVQLEEEVDLHRNALAIQEQLNQEKTVKLAQLQAEVHLLKKSLENRTREQNDLHQYVEHITQLESMTESLRQSSMQENKLKDQKLEEAKKNSAKLELEVESLRTAIEEKNNLLQHTTEWTTQLKQEFETLQGVSEKSARLEEKVEALKQYKENNAALQKEIDSLKHIKGEFRALEMELEKEKSNSAQFQAVISSLQMGKQCEADVQGEFLKAKEEIAQLEVEVKSMEELKEHSNQIKVEMETLKQIMSSERKEHLLQREQLEEKISVLEADLPKLRESAAQNEYTSRQVKELQLENIMLKDSLVAKEHDHQELTYANERIRSLEPRIAQLHGVIETYKRREQQLKMGYEKEMEELKELVANQQKDCKRIAHLEAELEANAKLKSEQDHENNLKEQKEENLNAEIQSLKLLIEEKEKMYGDLVLLSEETSSEKQRDNAELIEELKNAKGHISLLEEQLASLQKTIAEQEERHNEINLKMYLKGQEAAKFEHKDQVLEMAAQAPENVSVPELLSQLAETEKELDTVKAMYRRLAESQANNSSSPEATLLFLKSAFYYFLTDEANCQGHLHAIQSILGFTDAEKQTIESLTYFRR